MRKFIRHISIFLLPIIVMQLMAWILYTDKKGDLLRLGYIPNLYPQYRKIFEEEKKKAIKYTEYSDEKKERKYTVLTVGDSFSDEHSYGYKNYLAHNDSISVLHINRYFHSGPVQMAYGLANGDFFDSLDIRFLVLQIVERGFIEGIKNIDTTRITNMQDLEKRLEDVQKERAEESPRYVYPTDRILKVPFRSLQYLFGYNGPYNNEVYRETLIGDFFSVGNKEILFYKGDTEAAITNNNKDSIFIFNELLNALTNKLQKKGVTLIVLPAPDKFDIYYEYLINKEKYPKPLFFSHWESLEKKYAYVDAKRILDNAIQTEKDMYFYDDTHWSPWAARLIASELLSLIKEESVADTSLISHSTRKHFIKRRKLLHSF